jgi:glycosyltransferase involved in cell wall biosynthesis
MKIALIVKPGYADSGVGRYAQELERALLASGQQVILVHPVVPLPGWVLKVVKKSTGWDLWAFFNNYPVRIHYPQADIFHFSSQNLASLLFFCRPPGKVVITVHDIIPWLVRNDPELCVYHSRLDRFFDWLANKQLKRFHYILTDSDYSKGSLVKEFCIPAENIQTVLLAIDN